MSNSGSSGIGPPGGDTRRYQHHQYSSGNYQTGDGTDGHRGRSGQVAGMSSSIQADQQYYVSRGGGRDDTRRSGSGKYPDDSRKSGPDKGKHVRHSQSDGTSSPERGGRGGGSRHGDASYNTSRSAQPPVMDRPYAPTTGEVRSGHLELDSLYSASSDNFTVNSMNAPNNSTVQCGCENIDCPFCNLMMSVQMKE